MATHLLDVRGLGLVPVEGESREDAIAKFRGLGDTEKEALRADYVRDLRARQERLGLSDEDMAAIEQSRGLSRAPANAEESDAPGLFDPLGGHAAEGNRFLIGMGRELTKRGRGLRQVLAGWMGDEDVEQALAEIDADEKALFDIIDQEGIGWEDVGQAFPAAAAFLMASAATGGVGGGAMATGALLGYTDLLEDPENQGEATRAVRGLVQGTVAKVIPGAMGFVGRKLSGLGSVMNSVKNNLGVSVGSRVGGFPVWLRSRGANARPGMIKDTVDDALEMMGPQSNPGIRRLGEATLDRVSHIVNNSSLRGGANTPQREASEATMGVVQNALRKATIVDDAGPRLDLGVWAREMGGLTQNLRQALPSDSARALSALTTFARDAARTEARMSADQAYAVAAGLAHAPLRNGPLLNLINEATTAPAKAALSSRLVQDGINVLARTPGWAFRATPSTVPQQIAETNEQELEATGRGIADLAEIMWGNDQSLGPRQ